MLCAPFVIRRGVCGGVEVVVGMVYSSSPAMKAMVDPSEDILASRRGRWLEGRGSCLGQPRWVFNIDIYYLQMMEKIISVGQVS